MIDVRKTLMLRTLVPACALLLASCTGGDGPNAVQPAALGGQPPGTYNVKEAGAVGDGVADDTHAIRSAIEAAAQKGLGYEGVYFPPGHYRITANIDLPHSDQGYFGDRDGLSVIEANQDTQFGNTDQTKSLENIRIEDLVLVNTRVAFDGGEKPKPLWSRVKQAIKIRRCILIAQSPSLAGSALVHLRSVYHANTNFIEDCIFLKQAGAAVASEPFWAIKTWRTFGALIERNLIGLHLRRTGWLAGGWLGYPSWRNLESKLVTLQARHGLDDDQRWFAGGAEMYGAGALRLAENVFNGNASARLAHGDVIHAHGCPGRLELLGNWVGGWPKRHSTGLKLSNNEGPVVVIANHLVDVPLLGFIDSPVETEQKLQLDPGLS